MTIALFVARSSEELHLGCLGLGLLDGLAAHFTRRCREPDPQAFQLLC